MRSRIPRALLARQPAPVRALARVALLLALAPSATAGPADVLAVEVVCRPAPGGRPASVCKFATTVKHADAGWDHYANRYEIVTPNGVVLATRVLQHPHVDEQPFTRGISQVRIPFEIETVVVRAGDLVHGLGGKTVNVAIPHAKEAATPAPPPPPPAPTAEKPAP